MIAPTRRLPTWSDTGKWSRQPATWPDLQVAARQVVQMRGMSPAACACADQARHDRSHRGWMRMVGQVLR